MINNYAFSFFQGSQRKACECAFTVYSEFKCNFPCPEMIATKQKYSNSGGFKFQTCLQCAQQQGVKRHNAKS